MNKAKRPTWKTITKDGHAALRSPDGRIYYGTPREISECALMPWRRDALAKSQKLARHMAAKGTYTLKELREVCAENRREAVRRGYHDAADGACVTIPADVFVKLCAGARLVRDTFDDFLVELFNTELVALLDVAEAETGRREIPLTRHERAALERLRKADCGEGVTA